jgi:23S rRNA pseudouridine955/2504/2580 synthase
MSKVELIEVASDDEGIRLDRWFRQHYPDVGQGQLQKLLRKGQIRLDGAKAKTSDRVVGGQIIRVPPMSANTGKAGDDSKKNSVQQKAPIPDYDRQFMNDMVIYRDHHVIVLNKPSGLAVQGGSGTKRHIDGLLPALVGEGAERPRLVHRLDKDTSGVLVIAATQKAARMLTAEFRTKDAKKLYWALVAGAPRPGTGKIDLALSKAMVDDRSGGREQMIPDEVEGKRALTYYETLERAGKKLAWLALYPQTGRTHQLRVHMAEIGSPIIGDGKYGGEESMPSEGESISSKLHLHARSVSIVNPGGGKLEVTAPLIGHMKDTWKFLGFQESEYAAILEWPEFS